MTAPELVPGDRVTFPVTVSGTVLPSDMRAWCRVSVDGPSGTPTGPGANRTCVDCGARVTLELTGTWRAPHYVPCAVTGHVAHRVTS